jgi:hypothetical protein
MGKKSPGHIEQLPSGSWRVKIYGGTDPLTGREIRLRKTCKTERAAQIELGKLLEQAAAGRQPETNATVAELMDKYAEVADWDLSTRKAYEAYIRRVIKPALGHLQVRKIRGPSSTCSTRSCDGAAIPGAPASGQLSTGTCRPSVSLLRAAGLPGSRWPTRFGTRSAPGRSRRATRCLPYRR